MIEQRNDLLGNTKIAGRNKQKFSMHTMMLRAGLSLDDAELIKEQLISYSKLHNQGYFQERVSDNTKYMKFLVAEDFGFNKVVLRTSNTPVGQRHWMDIKINPRKMFHPYCYPYVYIASESDITKIMGRVQQFLDNVGITGIDNKCFYVQRIDYCVNINLGNECAVREYMRLMRKGACPYKGKRKMEYSESGKRMIPTRDSFTVSSKVYELSIYNKYRQLEKENQKYSPDEIEEAQGMIRIELRIKRQKIRNEERGGKVEDTEEFLMRTAVIAEKNISRYLNVAYGKGYFVKMAEAKEEIELAPYKNKTKKVMRDILELIAKKNMEYVKGVYGNEFRKYMKKFNDLGISPITIERASDIGLFYHPLYYVENSNKNYRD